MTSRRHHGIDENSGFKCHSSGCKSLFEIAHIERNDRTLCVANFKTFFFETFQRIVGHFPKCFQTLGFALQDAQCFQCRSRCGWRVRSREDVGARCVTKIVDDGTVGSDETTNGSQTLRECSHDEIHIIGESEVVANTTTLATKHTNTVCFIHHHRSSIFLFELNDFGQIAEITFHRENTIHNDEFHGILFTLLEFALQILHIVVLIAQLFCHRQTASIYDRSMVAIVANHIVVRTKECRNHTTVHRKPSGETEGFVLTHKLSEFFFQFHMKVERTI